MVSVSVTLFQGVKLRDLQRSGMKFGHFAGSSPGSDDFLSRRCGEIFGNPENFQRNLRKKQRKFPKPQEQPVTGTFTILGSQSSPGIVDSKSLSKHIVFAGPNHSITTRWLYKWPFWFPSWRSNCQVVKIYFQGFPLVRSLCCNISRWCWAIADRIFIPWGLAVGRGENQLGKTPTNGRK